MSKQYSWKKGAADFRKLDAQVIGEELETIRQENGDELRPDDIVAAARDRRSPLHSIFPWDDKQAAKMAREQIALRLTRSINVHLVRVDKPPIDTRAFVSVKMQQKERHYTAVEEALEDEEGRAYLIRKAWLELKAWKRRYAELTELAQVFDAIDVAEEARKAG